MKSGKPLTPRVVGLAIAVSLLVVVGLWAGEKLENEPFTRSPEVDAHSDPTFLQLQENFFKQLLLVERVGQSSQFSGELESNLELLVQQSAALSRRYKNIDTADEKWKTMQEHTALVREILVVLNTEYLEDLGREDANEQLRSIIRQLEGTSNEWAIHTGVREQFL